MRIRMRGGRLHRPNATAMRRRIFISIFPFFLLPLGGCTYHLAQIQEPGRAVAFTTAGPWRSMIYAAKTDSGTIVVDLGFVGAGHRLRSRLRSIGAVPGDVTDVFLTHSHRDHIAAWKTVRGARFHLWMPEEPLLEGEKRHADVPSRLATSVFGRTGPRPGEVDLRPFSADTAFVVGSDTVRAYPVPGHTPGSAAYLFRGILFVGDAVARKPLRGYGGADPLFSMDPRMNRQTLIGLFARVPMERVRWVCNAHAKCSEPTERFIRKVTR
ncbi:MBL fold metallo-hydrolase [Longimicrobium sp.]|uniref:MBL fold metallo-hydrolase n=1 Tax=Longimicrobium sp. TaxID=2029185 RepID=UPI002C8A510D|nr:MBL fold metallo-hydrolase [Longimicrobium sp.]HSU12907.1 MBL fold metallo-hydrolase [Longimicrobium sp.]